MDRCLFAYDIDNTLIYSRKHPHDGFECVEWIHGEEQAYMSPQTIIGMRCLLPKALFIPVTSRSIEQYQRVQFPAGCAPEWAVTACGADLLKSGEPDAEWRRETDAMIAAEKTELYRMHDLLKDDKRFIRCRMVDDAYLFVYCNNDISPSNTAAELQAFTPVTVIEAGKKIYLIPSQLNKGTAMDRLKARFNCPIAVSAGDSKMDLPMLERADCAIIPKALSPYWAGTGKCIQAEENILFSEFALKEGLSFVYNAESTGAAGTKNTLAES